MGREGWPYHSPGLLPTPSYQLYMEIGGGGGAGNFQIHKGTKKITYKTGPAKIIIITINK